MPAISHLVVAASLLAALACSGNAVGPAVPLNDQFTLAPRETASVRDTSLRLAFMRVSGDSRCPADALCIQGGDAIVLVRATDARMADLELHTGDRNRAMVVHEGYRIELVELRPYPFSSRTIDPGDYRATLRVTR